MDKKQELINKGKQAADLLKKSKDKENNKLADTIDEIDKAIENLPGVFFRVKG